VWKKWEFCFLSWFYGTWFLKGAESAWIVVTVWLSLKIEFILGALLCIADTSSGNWCGHQHRVASQQSFLHWTASEACNWQGVLSLLFSSFFCNPLDSLAVRHSGKLLVIFFPQEYDELLHEFMSAVKQAYGEKVLVQVSANTTSSHRNPHLWLCVLEGFNVVIQSSVVYCIECCDQLVPLCGIDANFCSPIFTVNLVVTDWFSFEMSTMGLEYMHPSM
jgi:hypothetical protein